MSQAPETGPEAKDSFRHEVQLRHRVGPLSLDVRFELTQPWTVLFAPSGAGKSTILRIIAGLERPDSGFVAMRTTLATRPPLPERLFVLTDTVAKIMVPPHKRVVRYVAQRPALFPHKTVLDNVIYRMPSMVRDEDERRERDAYLETILTLCRISELRHKMPSQLSGGERQRVALARAIAAGFGHLLMLDEPFTGMDGVLRDEMIAGLKEWQAKVGSPILMVTHDLGEVFATGAEVMRMEDGRIVAVGPAEVVLASERERLLRVLSSKADPLRG